MTAGGPATADRVRGALLGLACGDALGAPVEFQGAAFVQQRYGTLRDMVGGGNFGWAPGEWTDDTGMTLAVAEGLLESADDPIEAVGRRFLDWQRTAKDVGSTIAAALRAFDGNWAEASASTPQARAGKAGGNGSLMRTLPVALFYADEDRLLRESARISAMTHWDPQAEVCCAAYCLWVRELLADDAGVADGIARADAWARAVARAEAVASRGRLAADAHGPAPLPDAFWPRLRGMPSVPISRLQPSGYAGFVVECLEGAVAAVVQSPSLEDALVLLVNLGGESDTMAAVAGGAAGALWGVDAIPRRWLDVLHDCERIERVAQAIATARDSGSG